jgi:hypothetical protein
MKGRVGGDLGATTHWCLLHLAVQVVNFDNLNDQVDGLGFSDAGGTFRAEGSE